MQIPARVVVEKMEEELNKLKLSLDSSSSSSAYREQAAAIKTYCDLLLSTQSSGTAAPTVQHATKKDVTELRSNSVEDRRENRSSIYDEDNTPDSDSLFDF